MNRSLRAIQDKIGFVPMFLQTMGSLTDTIEPEFEQMRRYWFASSALPARSRAVLGIAVSAALGYRALGALHTGICHDLSDGDINEAQFIACHTLGWSSYLVGRGQSLEGFRRDVERLRQGLERFVKEGGTWSPESTIQDQIRAVYGFSPEFLSDLARLPGALDAAWSQLKNLTLHRTHLTPQEKALAGLATAAVSRCPYAVCFYTALGRVAGLSEVALQECALLARQNAQWGAYLHVRGLGPEALVADSMRLRTVMQQVAAP